MQGWRFDDLTRTLGKATSRRQVLKGFAGVILGGVLASVIDRGPDQTFAATQMCNNFPYDPSTQCCEPAGIQQRYPITNLDLCPNRVPHPGYVPPYNGCGPENSPLTPYIPNHPLDLADFTPACNNHDICYGTCNTVKDQCDWNFYFQMTEICKNAYPGQSFLSRWEYESCVVVAGDYYMAVHLGGHDAYVSAQQLACDCCPPCQDCNGPNDKCCDYTCIDTSSDNNNCGDCNVTCSSCETCSNGTCTPLQCGTGKVCCQHDCVDQCGEGQTLDPATCRCVDLCTNVTCGECQTCDPGSGQCVQAADQTACGNNQVCCSGVCQDTCGTCPGLPCSNGDCCDNDTDWACCQDGCCPQVTIQSQTGAWCVAPGSVPDGLGGMAGNCCQPSDLVKGSYLDDNGVCQCSGSGPYEVWCSNNLSTDNIGTRCSCGSWLS